MLKRIDSNQMGKSKKGWLESWHHFSFGEYYDPNNLQYGVLRVVNDDLIQPGGGFDFHAHTDMEIITYVVEGRLTHMDTMGNSRVLTRGQVQYMSAGTGVVHGEFNRGPHRVRLLQIWVIPDRDGYPPAYGDYQFKWEDREGCWLPLVSDMEGGAPVRIHQDMRIFAAWAESGHTLAYTIGAKRQGYLIQIEGESDIGRIHLRPRDAVEIQNETIELRAADPSHYLLFDMKLDE